MVSKIQSKALVYFMSDRTTIVLAAICNLFDVRIHLHSSIIYLQIIYNCKHIRYLNSIYKYTNAFFKGKDESTDGIRKI